MGGGAKAVAGWLTQGCPSRHLWVFLAEQAWRAGPEPASLTVGTPPRRTVDRGGEKMRG
ncbi:hypothetical protein P7K49_017344, partial [Saguinus oedipus]